MSNRVFGIVCPLATSLGNRMRTQKPLEEAICRRDTGFAFPSTDTWNKGKNHSWVTSSTAARPNCKTAHQRQEILTRLCNWKLFLHKLCDLFHSITVPQLLLATTLWEKFSSFHPCPSQLGWQEQADTFLNPRQHYKSVYSTLLNCSLYQWMWGE